MMDEDVAVLWKHLAKAGLIKGGSLLVPFQAVRNQEIKAAFKAAIAAAIVEISTEEAVIQ